MQNSTAPVIVFAIVGIAALITGLLRRQKGTHVGPLKPRDVLTKNEQGMYWRLRQTFPDAVVLAQVAFSALITTRSTRDRNRFNRKVADFVLCDKSMKVIAVIELDDASHKGRDANDAKRDELLTKAGYRVLRFPRTPDIDTLRNQILPTAPTPSPVAK